MEAIKQATVFCVDLGSTTAECSNGRVESNLDYCLKYFWSKVGDIMGTGRKGLSVGVIGFRTDATQVPLQDDSGYENTSLLKPLGQFELSEVESLKQKLVSNSTKAGDSLSAIVVATQMIVDFTTLKTGKLGKYERTIVVLTDGHGTMDASDLDDIAEKINEVKIKLIVIGVDFDDPDFGFKEEDKPEHKRKNEETFKILVEKCGDNAVYGTIAEANQNLSIPEPKNTKPYVTFKGRLTLGDVEKYPATALFIDVVRYFKTKRAVPPAASSFVSQPSFAHGVPSTQHSYSLPDMDMTDGISNSGRLSAVRSAFNYSVNDPSCAGGKRDVPRDELSKGYAYGSTAVPVSESDQNVTQLETLQSFSIVGFIPSDKYEKYFSMAESCITIAQPTNDKAKMALSSLIHALHELDSYAIARIVIKDGKDPEMLLLAPIIEPDLEALIDVQLPFAEDVRIYRFPPLDRVITTSGSILTKHRNLPTDELASAMSSYVDAMDLSLLDRDDEGNATEYMPIEETYSPVVHRIKQAVRDRAVHPDNPIGEPAEILTKWSHPPSQLVSAADSQLHKLIKSASVKKVPPKVKGKRGTREVVKPLSGLDVESLLSRSTRQKLSEGNAIPEFRQMLSNTTDDNGVVDAAKQMGEIIRVLVKNSMGDSRFAQAAANMKVLREEIIDFEMPELYNDFIKDFKKRLAKGDFGGYGEEFWEDHVKSTKLGLIDNKILEISEITEDEAKEFYTLSAGLPTRSKK